MTIKKYLESLGKTEAEVVANLMKDGIKGIRNSLVACPIIRGIRKNCSENPMIGYLRAISPGVLRWNDVQVLDPQCPNPVTLFMSAFDNGEYPKLEE